MRLSSATLLPLSLTVLGAAALPWLGAGCGDDDTSSAQGGASSVDSSSNAGGMGGIAGMGGAMAEGGGGSGGDGGSAGGAGGMGGSCQNTLPNERIAPDKLSMTGLYADISTKQLAAYVQEYEPQYPLWSDGVDKQRWVYLPECGQIDSSDMDSWDFPVGTRMWKEFSLNGVRLETRMVHRFGPGSGDFLYVTYQWDDMEADGDPNPMGQDDVKGTEHDIPDVDSCNRCHGPHPAKGGTPARYLGFSAIQLSHAGSGVTITTLSNDGSLSNPAPNGFTTPGTMLDQQALGYFHANCGNCHNDTSDGLIFPFMDMQLKTTDTTVEMTATYTTSVNQLTLLFLGMGCDYRIAGMDVMDSCVHQRMSIRGSDMMPNMDQMPPLATDVVDTAAVGIVEQWIGTLPAPP